MSSRDLAGELPPFHIKICGITSFADGQNAVDAGATALGFNFYQASPRYLTPRAAQGLVEQITGAYVRVGVFVNAESTELEVTLSAVALDVVQLHGTLPKILPRNVRLWRAVPATHLPAEPDPAFEHYLLDTPSSLHGGSGLPFDWSLVAGFPAPFLVAGGLQPQNVAEAVRRTHAAGVDACSRLESAPGVKDPDLVRNFVQNAAEAHRQLLANEMIVTV